MAEYYAVERSSEYLAHYGVKGMRWGVRKALEKGNMQKLAYHYQRAMSKRDKLKQRTNRKDQKEEAKAYGVGGAALLGAGALGGLTSYGIIKGQGALNKGLNSLSGRKNDSSGLYMVPSGLIGMSALSAGGGLAALGAGAASAYRATKRGNKKAVEKYKRFSKEMNKTFNRSTRKKAQEYLRKHPEERFDYDPVSNTFVSEKYATPAQKKALEKAYYGNPEKRSAKKRK